MSEMTAKDKDFVIFYNNIRLLSDEDLLQIKKSLRTNIIKKSLAISDTPKMKVMLDFLLRITK
jgi:hypothetical protein